MILSVAIVLLSCSTANKQTLPDEDEKVAETSVEAQNKTDTKIQEDTTIYYDVFSTLDIADPLKYFRENNKYTDWNKADEKRVLVEFVSEKDGTTSQVKVRRTCGVDKLDNEALRLVEKLKYEEPAKDANGRPIRGGNMVIFVFFPPK